MPVGAYSYSHGLEGAVAAGRVSDAASLGGYIETVLRQGTARLDALFLRAAHQAADRRRLRGRLARRDRDHGRRDARHQRARAGEHCPGPGAARGAAAGVARARARRAGRSLPAAEVGPPYAVVARRRHRRAAPAAAAALTAFLHAFAANLVSAGIRLIPLGQTAGQQLTAALEPTVAAAAATALTDTLADAGTATPAIDLLSIAHETQYTRLFRS